MNTFELLEGIPEGVTLFGEYTEQGNRLIAAMETVSYYVRDGLTDEIALFQGDKFVEYLKTVPGLDQIKVLLPLTKKYVRLKPREL